MLLLIGHTFPTLVCSSKLEVPALSLRFSMAQQDKPNNAMNISTREVIFRKKISHEYQPNDEGNASNNASQGQKKKGTCNYCKVLGHYIVECPKRIANKMLRLKIQMPQHILIMHRMTRTLPLVLWIMRSLKQGGNALIAVHMPML